MGLFYYWRIDMKKVFVVFFSLNGESGNFIILVCDYLNKLMVSD